MDYGENSCRLIRTFAEGKQKTVLVFESAGPGQMDMLVVGNGIKGYSGDSDRVPARFLPVGGKRFDGMAAKSAETGAPGVLWSQVEFLPDDLADSLEKERDQRELIAKRGRRPPALDAAEEAAVKAARMDFAARATELQIGGRGSILLETGPLGEPMKVFDQCGRDSLRAWGVKSPRSRCGCSSTPLDILPSAQV